jgi:predicted enzyme related to lactoylglutathione lyase
MSFTYQRAFVTLATSESDNLVHFYRQLFNLQPNPYIPKVYAEFQLKGLRLGIFQFSAANPLEFANTTRPYGSRFPIKDASGSSMSLCLEVPDLEKAIAYLQELGYPPPGKIINASHGREIYAYDPIGNRLILHEAAEDYLSNKNQR